MNIFEFLYIDNFFYYLNITINITVYPLVLILIWAFYKTKNQNFLDYLESINTTVLFLLILNIIQELTYVINLALSHNRIIVMYTMFSLSRVVDLFCLVVNVVLCILLLKRNIKRSLNFSVILAVAIWVRLVSNYILSIYIRIRNSSLPSSWSMDTIEIWIYVSIIHLVSFIIVSWIFFLLRRKKIKTEDRI